MGNSNDNHAFNLWLCYTHAGSFLKSTSSIDAKHLASLEGICDDALTRMMEIKAQILNAKEAIKKVV
jgi:hypothetical protein